jgi:hypothetical protein
MNEERTDVRPRFGRGQERPDDTAEKHGRPNFARGQAGSADAGERGAGEPHQGEFATGQETVTHHPERHLPGRFSRVQRRPERRG